MQDHSSAAPVQLAPSSMHASDFAHLPRLKPRARPVPPADLTGLDLTRQAFVYQRQSSYEQKRKHIWSQEAQDALIEQALTDGFREEQVVVERRDLGLTGTKGSEFRPGLAHQIALIEAGQVGAVYVVAVNRLTRDQTLIDGLELAELYKRYNVVLCLPTHRLNLRDKFHERIYRIECERAAEEIDGMQQRLGVPRRLKARAGYYAGGPLPLGYVVAPDGSGAGAGRLAVYEPHAAIVRAIFDAYAETPSPRATAARLVGLRIPPWPPERERDAQRSALRSRRPAEAAVGWAITPNLVRSVVHNPVYLGWWVVTGEAVSTTNHPPIVSEAQFQTANAAPVAPQASGSALRRRRSPAGTAPLLAGLATCVRHPAQGALWTTRSRAGSYTCPGDYRRDPHASPCLYLDARTLDEPVSDAFLATCDVRSFAEGALATLEAVHEAQAEAARARRQRLRALETEIANLKANLEATQLLPARAEWVFARIEEKEAAWRQEADAAARPVARILSAAEVASVRAFFSNLRPYWALMPAAERRELLALLLTEVSVEPPTREALRVRLAFADGRWQELEITLPAKRRPGKAAWSAAEDALLEGRYATSPMADLVAALPGRTAGAVRDRAQDLGLRRAPGQRGGVRRAPWTEAEDAALYAHAAGTLDAAALAAALGGRTERAVVERQRRLGLTAGVPLRVVAFGGVLDEGANFGGRSPTSPATRPAMTNILPFCSTVSATMT